MLKEKIIYQVWILGLDKHGSWTGFDYLVEDYGVNRANAEILFDHLIQDERKISDILMEHDSEFQIPDDPKLEQFELNIEEVTVELDDEDEDYYEELETNIIKEFIINKEDF
jgi:hypothetical protein